MSITVISKGRPVGGLPSWPPVSVPVPRSRAQRVSVAGEAGVLDAEVEVVGVGAQLADDGGDAGWPDDACWPGGCLELVFHEVGRDEPVEDSEVAVVASIGQITPVAFELQYSRQIADSQKAA